MAEEYYLLKEGTAGRGHEPALLFIFDTGYYTIVTGWGELFDVYCETKKLGPYTGHNVKPRNPNDADYGESRLRILPFDHAFAFIRKNIEESEYKVGYINTQSNFVFLNYISSCYTYCI